MQIPLDAALVQKTIRECEVAEPGLASIRELGRLIDRLEKVSGVDFIRMEMGVPGLPASPHGVRAEIEALRAGVANAYPKIEGIPELKEAASRFFKAFLNISVAPASCIPCSGSTNGSFLALMVAGRREEKRNTTLFLDPGFPVHKMQVRSLGLEQVSLDVYDYRGEKLRSKLESILERGNISTILYSNPNNPTWICLSERELKIIGELATKHEVVVLEDSTYLGMDFRRDYSRPGEPPFPPTVARYTDNWIILFSSSKLFSYAGQRVALVTVSDSLSESRWPRLLRYFSTEKLGHAIIYGGLYAVSAGVTHSAQYGLTAILKEACSGEYPFLDEVKLYGRLAHDLKRIFQSNGFRIVYDRDDEEEIADGFYFTISYPGLSGVELIEELLAYGVSAISLANTGSTRREGIRACVSQIPESSFPELERRLQLFHQHRSVDDPVEA